MMKNLLSILVLSQIHSATPFTGSSSWIQANEARSTESSDASPIHKRGWTKTEATQPWWSVDEDYPNLQEPSFAPSLWGLSGIPQPLPEPTLGDNHVRFFVYDIGGAMTKVLSMSVSKELPLIPHVGIRIHGTEWFYSDHVENRKSGVMAKMLSPTNYPQCQFDLGPTNRSTEEIAKWLTESQSRYNKDTYSLWHRNCNHFAREFAEFLCPDENGIPKALMDPVLDVTENMLDALPEWRRLAGNAFMDKVSRFVVISWGGVVKQEKERIKQELEQKSLQSS